MNDEQYCGLMGVGFGIMAFTALGAEYYFSGLCFLVSSTIFLSIYIVLLIKS